MGLVVIAGTLSPAVAGTALDCSFATDTATFTMDQEGTSLRVAFAYQDTGATNDVIAQRYRGRDAQGMAIEGSGGCGQTGSTWVRLDVLLGDRADDLRLDGRKPKYGPGYGALPDFVDTNLYGGAGNDVIRGHKGFDSVHGDGGNDTIRIDGGGADIADCGGGDDKVYIDASDDTVDCEKIV